MNASTSTNTIRPPQPQATEPGQQGDSRVPSSMTPQPGERPGGDRPNERRRRTNPASAHALAMLTRQPVFAAPVPRLHVGRRGADGSMLVEDRASDRRFRVYTPRLDSQFRAGYRAGLWYVRTPGDAEPTPRSPGFPTVKEAVDTLHSSSRSLPPHAARQSPRCRVIWS
jgi:hypothetical protein